MFLSQVEKWDNMKLLYKNGNIWNVEPLNKISSIKVWIQNSKNEEMRFHIMSHILVMGHNIIS